ncbi:ribbon-helix-helix domain-containing protein [Thauera phenylacetica]|nr:hypothetical protein [Thauera phenylacetica]
MGEHRHALNSRPVNTGRALVASVFNIDYPEYTHLKRNLAMPPTTTMTVRVSGALSEFVATNVGETGAYENVSEYIRDLIRRDKERVEQQTFQRLQAELAQAFAAPDATYIPLAAAEVIARNRARPAE